MQRTPTLILLSLLAACGSTGSNSSGGSGSSNWWSQDFSGFESDVVAAVESNPTDGPATEVETVKGVHAPVEDKAEQLRKLSRLHEIGLLTEAEFAAAKQRITGNDPPTALPPADVAPVPAEEVPPLPPVEVKEASPLDTPPVEPVGDEPLIAQDAPSPNEPINSRAARDLFSFQYTEVNYGQLSLGDFDVTGIGLEYRTAFPSGTYAAFSFATMEDEYGYATANSFGVALGKHLPVNENTELYGSLGFAHVEIETYDSWYYSSDASEFVLSGGALYSPMDNVLLEAGATHVDGEFSFEYGARWFVADQVSLGFSWVQLDGYSEDMTLFGLRWSY